MALVKLYEADQTTTFIAPDGWNNIFSHAMMWSVRDDACLYFGPGNDIYGTHKIFRDGTAVRRVRSVRGAHFIYDADDDRIIQLEGISGVNYNIDTMHHIYNPNQAVKIGYNASVAGDNNGTIYRNELYKGVTVTNVTTVSLKDPATGSVNSTFQTTATITPFQADLTIVTKDGLCLLIDTDNGTYGVIQFYDLSTSTLLYESTIPRAYQVAVDPVNKNIISAGVVSNKIQVHSFQPAPYSLSLSMSANRSRYKSDTLQATLKGSNNEVVPNWPIGWRLSQPLAGGGFLGDYALGLIPLGSAGSPGSPAEGDLDVFYQLTDENGVVDNIYCGPGAADFVGQSATIQVWTGY